ncbi:hypothetical protein ARMA_0900 [Ardenticatena maritima]|uniref:Phosphodiesterase n=1 Tax=Ardenticatena maritima TaxID=872965 RepID=A0A0N0RFK4_9CHLR|nr:alkaline phosphatase family protein [Ardenticatena maritima]KPL89415.1 hypothetical protein SE16_02905 [Ardenticatena maritima]GAP62477.1 hypothetical protein ARMA_0900 [Ardenticatena maritima]
MSRILIIGLDGASPHLIRQWQNELPNLARLIEGGKFGVLQSITPPRSIPAWYCFATGTNPAKLGVFGFSQRLPGTYDYTFANFTYCRTRPFWDYLGEAGITTAVIHLPGTFPPRPLHGVMVSGWPAPANHGSLVYTHPPALSREIDAILGQPFEFLSPHPIARDNDELMRQERLRILRLHTQTALHVLRTTPWQVGVVVLSPLDRASHQFWKHMDPTHPQHNPAHAARLGDALLDIYRAHDDAVGQLLDLITPDDWVFIVSDHGFGPTHRVFYLNEWLMQQGYLVLKEKPQAGRLTWRTRLLGRAAAPLFWLNHHSETFRRLAAPFKKRALSNAVRHAYVRTKTQGLVRLNHLPVDWSRTRAYCPDEGALYLNLKGRDPQGIVEPGQEAERLLDEIEAGLRALQPPDTTQPLEAHIIRKEAVYEGPYMLDAPDMLVALDHYRTDVMAEVGAGMWDLNPVRSANHTPEGVLVAHGPGIAAGSAAGGLMDIAPTVLHMLGFPVPEEMDGRVLLDLFTEESAIRRRPVTYAATAVHEGAGEAFSEEDQAYIEKQLRDLGYLG